MKKHKWVMQKIVLFMSLLFIGMINILCYYVIFTSTEPSQKLIPYSRIVLPLVHGIVLIISIYLLFKYNYLLQFSIFQIESIICILSTFQSLGIFLYYASVFIFIINRYGKKEIKVPLIISFCIHIIALLLNFIISWADALVYLFSSFFVFACFLWFYEILKTKFSSFIPTSVNNKSVLSNVKQGSSIYLSDYGLTERQINIIYDYIHNNLNFKELSEKYYVSISSIKKEFTDVYKIFNVTKLEELHILLLQYVVDK